MTKQERKVTSDKRLCTVGGILTPHLSALNYKQIVCTRITLHTPYSELINTNESETHWHRPTSPVLGHGHSSVRGGRAKL